MFRRCALIVAVAWLAPATALLAQPSAAFEVVSVKPAAPLDMQAITATIAEGKRPRLGARVERGRAEYFYVGLPQLISRAYGVKGNQIQGPGWMNEQMFDIVAKMPDGASADDEPKMLQTLLADRFKLAFHRENKEVQAMALVVAEGGPKLKASEPAKPFDPAAPLAPGEKQLDSSDGLMRVTTLKDGESINMGARGTLRYTRDPTNRTTKMEASQLTMGALADMLTTFLRVSGSRMDVKDMTGLTGSYAVSMSFATDDLKILTGADALAEAPDPSGGQSIFRAAQSLGLKLVQRKVPVEQLVIDHVEKTPTEN